jgi:hypothetical protein
VENELATCRNAGTGSRQLRRTFRGEYRKRLAGVSDSGTGIHIDADTGLGTGIERQSLPLIPDAVGQGLCPEHRDGGEPSMRHPGTALAISARVRLLDASPPRYWHAPRAGASERRAPPDPDPSSSTFKLYVDGSAVASSTPETACAPHLPSTLRCS